MFTIDPRLPMNMLATYYGVTLFALVLCSLSLVAVYRTKKTPLSSKLLSMGLLTFDSVFLILASASKLFKYYDVLILWHLSRGFQIAGQIIVGSMALERLFVLNWPYVFLRVATDGRIKRVCTFIIVFSYLQYVLVRGIACYARNRAAKCGVAFTGYYIAIAILVPGISVVSYFKIYRIIREGSKMGKYGHGLNQYKGTVASFLVLINSTVTQILSLALSALNVLRLTNGLQGDGYAATLADCVNIINCIVDPLIYVIWFKETRMQALMIIGVICPYVKPTVCKLKTEIYSIPGGVTPVGAKH